MEPLFIVLAVAGFVEFARRIHVKDYFAAITIAGAAVIGIVAGLLGAPGVSDAWNGLIAGLSASGLITTASKVNTSGPLQKQ